MRDELGRVFVVGFDGATFDLIRPWVEQGLLPTFARLMAEGASAALRSTIPFFSAPAWSTFMTGVNPGRHGVFDFVQPRGITYELELTNAAIRKAPSMWSLLSQQGRKVASINVPMTYPPEHVNGVVISGFDAPDLSSQFTYPAELYSELTQVLGRYAILPNMIGVTLHELVESYLEITELRGRAARYLWGRDQYDLFCVVFNGSDALQHLCYRRPLRGEQAAALLSIYQAYDRFLKAVMAGLPEDVTLLIMSDHGAGPIKAFVYLNRWLANGGWLTLADSGVRLRSPAAWVRRTGAVAAGRAVDLMRRCLPVEWRRRLKRYRGLQGRVQSLVASSRIDWSRTRAYTRNMQGIYINLKGRQPEGVVEPGQEYEEICSRLVEGLLALRDPDDSRVGIVDQVFRKEEVFSGPYADVGPDLYIRWRDDAYLARLDMQPIDGPIFDRPSPAAWEDVLPARNINVHVGTHRWDGILMAWGKAIQPGVQMEGARLIDLTPTLFYLLGQPVPSHMEGKVLTSMCQHSYLRTHRLQRRDAPHSGAMGTGSAYSAEDEEKVRDRLEGLGYL